MFHNYITIRDFTSQYLFIQTGDDKDEIELFPSYPPKPFPFHHTYPQLSKSEPSFRYIYLHSVGREYICLVGDAGEMISIFFYYYFLPFFPTLTLGLAFFSILQRNQINGKVNKHFGSSSKSFFLSFYLFFFGSILGYRPKSYHPLHTKTHFDQYNKNGEVSFIYLFLHFWRGKSRWCYSKLNNDFIYFVENICCLFTPRKKSKEEIEGGVVP